jgi:NADH-quinone oxidoreductase subunit L
MALYQYAYLILLAPLFAFAVILFVTRVGDMLSRPRVAVAAVHGEEHEHGTEVHPVTVDEHGPAGEAGTHGDVGDKGKHDAHGEHDAQDEDDDPQVPHLSGWAYASSYVAMVIMALACVYSYVLLFSSMNSSTLPENGITVLSYTWLNAGPLHYTIAFHLDRLAIAMLVVVSTIGLLVQFYSQGYMENSAGYSRFYAYLSLFVFSMFLIVFAENFLVIFVGWELVGLSSYLLIGFWINKRAKPEEQRPSPANASMQSFIMNRIGDVGFIVGIMILFVNTGTFDFVGIHSAIIQNHIDPVLISVAMIFVFCGAIGKSAQFPLHTWLPSAMEGPTPVSALIHAATMVAAGVYMVARTYPLFATATPAAFGVVGWIGAFTAFFAATIALVQSDFKRVLAFSTISQLGYMFVGLGVAGPEYGAGPGMFHLFTHAFFKALLFLGAGSVLHGLHHATHREVQDTRVMGGLATRMPITAATWLIATLAISGFPGFAGFFSKEEIIGLSLENGQIGIYILTLVTAGLTAFYMLRAFILAFGGKGGSLFGLWGGPYRGEGEVHESPLTMTIPLIILAVFSVIAGYWFGFFQYINVTGADIHNLNVTTLLSAPDTWIGVIVSVAGLAVAWWMYGTVSLAKIHQVVENSAALRTIHRVLYNRYYMDTLYNKWIAQGLALGITRLEQWFDANVIDGIVNGVAWLVGLFGREVRYTETGRVQSYMLTFFGGIAILAIVVFFLVR